MEKNESFRRIEKIIADFSTVHRSYTERNSKVYSSFLKLMGEATKDGVLAKKYKELISICMGLAAACEHCVYYHVNEARKSGATEEEIVEAVHVAIEMGGGPIVIKSHLVFDVLEYLKAKGGVKTGESAA
jgi:AhpD family alkylhydroperoxidase